MQMHIDSTKRILNAICVIAVAAIIFFGYQAYDKKNNYFNSDVTFLNENAYVGGDAYNYIINAEYFAGYASLAGACAITAVISFSCGAMLQLVESPARKRKNFDGIPYQPTETPVPTEMAAQQRRKISGETGKQIVLVIAVVLLLILFIFLYASE